MFLSQRKVAPVPVRLRLPQWGRRCTPGVARPPYRRNSVPSRSAASAAAAAGAEAAPPSGGPAAARPVPPRPVPPARWLSHSPASAAPQVVMRTATRTPGEGMPSRSTRAPVRRVTRGKQRLKTTYMGRLRPRSDQRVRVDCSVARAATAAKGRARRSPKGGSAANPRRRSASSPSAAAALLRHCSSVRKAKW